MKKSKRKKLSPLDSASEEKMPTDLKTWEAWNNIHQPFELNWWKEALANGHSQDDEKFANQWNEVKEFIEPSGSIIDIGCGPRPPFVPCTVIEPLAYEYQKLVPLQWWLHVAAYAQPAEERISGLTGDTIICWNAIDHLIGWKDVLDNMIAYGNPNARFAIATDFQDPFDGHPGFKRTEFMNEINKRFNIHKKKEPFGRAMALLMTAKKPN